MTNECQRYIRSCVDRFPKITGDVLEVGSFDVCGNPREHFADRARFPSYLGIDMREGPRVDRVENCQDLSILKLDFPNQFGVIVDAERLEHDSDFFKSYRELHSVLRPGGHIIITTRSWGGFGPHDYPSDYWRFMDHGLQNLLVSTGFECIETEYGEMGDVGPRAVFALGRKP